jgi:phosphoribosyl-AMP cyclohydrolase
MSPIDESVIAELKFNEQGLIPAIVQSESGRVLMLAWMNAESIKKTLELEESVFFSRSRNEIWHKGATSGNTQQVLKIELDCDGDALLVLVREAGAACHTGTESCFDVETLFISEDD